MNDRAVFEERIDENASTIMTKNVVSIDDEDGGCCCLDVDGRIISLLFFSFFFRSIRERGWGRVGSVLV